MEKSEGFRGLGTWKIPTGVVDEGEDICAATVREVKEETGIDAEFIEIVAFRQTHKAFFEKSDLFFMCFLRPLSFNIQRQGLEIEAARVLTKTCVVVPRIFISALALLFVFPLIPIYSSNF